MAHPQQDVRQFMGTSENDAMSEPSQQKTKRRRKRTLDESSVTDEVPFELPEELDEEDFQQFKRAKLIEPEAEDPAETPELFRNLVNDLNRWYKAFPEDLAKFSEHNDPEKMKSCEQVKNAIRQCRVIVNSPQTGGFDLNEEVPRMFLMGYEKLLCNLTPIKAEGIHQLANEPNFARACKEFMLENFNFYSYIPPHIKIMLMLGHTTWMIHDKNSSNQQQAEAKTSEFAAPKAQTQQEPLFNPDPIKQ